jgi:hypothetical protein
MIILNGDQEVIDITRKHSEDTVLWLLFSQFTQLIIYCSEHIWLLFRERMINIFQSNDFYNFIFIRRIGLVPANSFFRSFLSCYFFFVTFRVEDSSNNLKQQRDPGIIVIYIDILLLVMYATSYSVLSFFVCVNSAMMTRFIGF